MGLDHDEHRKSEAIVNSLEKIQFPNLTTTCHFASLTANPLVNFEAGVFVVNKMIRAAKVPLHFHPPTVTCSDSFIVLLAQPKFKAYP